MKRYKAKHIKREYIVFLISIISGLFFIGCINGDKIQNDKKIKIYYKGTPSYNEIIKTFIYSENDAKGKIFDFEKKRKKIGRDTKVFTGTPFVVIENDYLFSIPDKIGISLTGYYVNGLTGDVSWKTKKGRLKYFYKN